MKSVMVALALVAMPVAALAEEAAPATAVQGETVVARVNGMVCDFCAQAVTKVFKKEKAVTTVDVNLDTGAITLGLKPGETLSDARIAELVKKSGYALVEIVRDAA